MLSGENKMKEGKVCIIQYAQAKIIDNLLKQSNCERGKQKRNLKKIAEVCHL
jgi:hypothetical protein